MKRLIAILLIGCFLFNCSSEDQECLDSRMGEEISIQVFDTVTYCKDSFWITFNDYPKDSRCPSDVTCIWAGYVEVELLINEKGSETSLKLSTEPSVTGHPVSTRIGDYTIKLIDVIPYPATNIRINPDQYKVILLVEKASS